MARIDELKTELTSIRARISEATEAASLSIEVRSLTRQGLESLREREAELSWAIEEYYSGSPFGQRTVFRQG